MKLNIFENKAHRLVFEVEGAGHTLCNALKEELRNDSSVTMTTYTINHPLQGKPIFQLETNKDGKPKDALATAVKSLKKKNSEFLKAFKAMK